MIEESFGIIPIFEAEVRLEFLLIQHLAGHWSFPKGHKELGEEPLEAALRELKEETGIDDVILLCDEPLQERYVKHSANGATQKIVTFYIAKSAIKDVRIQVEEVKSYAWLDYETALERITFSESKEILKKTKEILDDK